MYFITLTSNETTPLYHGVKRENYIQVCYNLKRHIRKGLHGSQPRAAARIRTAHSRRHLDTRWHTDPTVRHPPALASRFFLNALKALEDAGYLVRYEKSVTVKNWEALQQAVYDNLTSAENAGYVRSTLERKRQLSGACPPHVHVLETRTMQYSGSSSNP